jgi:hypothetical protein
MKKHLSSRLRPTIYLNPDLNSKPWRGHQLTLSVRGSLRSERESLPLFDIQRLTSEFERGMLMSWYVFVYV